MLPEKQDEKKDRTNGTGEKKEEASVHARKKELTPGTKEKMKEQNHQ